MFEWIKSVFRSPPPALPARVTVPVSSLGPAPISHAYDDGSKFPGGFGETYLLTADYWTLRARSKQLFETNLYARGFIRRLITNEINTGLHLEAIPEEKLLGFPEDGLAEWTEDIEVRFRLWGQRPGLCDHEQRRTFGALQRAVRMAALIEGDVLIVRRQDPLTGLPRLQLISGSAVRSPMKAPRKGHRISHGVELDKFGRHVAYWVQQRDGKHVRMPAWGEKSGRRIAWMLYGTEVLLDDVRGKPILSLVLQSLREIDRYRDSIQRKAVINAMLAMFIKKNEDKPGTLPLTGGAVRVTSTAIAQEDDSERTFHTAEHIPGLIIDELQHGEEPTAFNTQGTTEEFGKFEEAIIQAFAWANEIPPEIMRLAFSNNYSASQAAINEFKIYLHKVRTDFGETFCTPVYVEWLLSEAVAQKIEAARFLESWRDRQLYDVFAAWIACDWSGHIKPAVDLSKLVRGYREMCTDGFMTRDRACRELTGMKFSKVVKRLRLENEQLAEALAPLGALAEPAAGAPPQEAASPQDDAEPIDDDDDDGEDDTDGEDDADEQNERAA